MTISKKLKSRSESTATLEYVYRGEKSHPVLGKNGKLLLNNARHIGGQLSSPDPFQYGPDCKPNQVNVDELAAELDLQVTKYKGIGSGKNLIQHYVISLAPGETLSDKKWRKVVKMFMDEMGYGNDTLYTACVHTEKDHEHAHIVACRVRHNGKLVPDQKDYAKAVDAARKIEIAFGLKITANPDETMGVEPTRKEVELDKKNIKKLADDPAVIIRDRMSSVFDAKPKTMTDFISLLRKQYIKFQIKTNAKHEPIGINYSIDGDLWISGSKIKKTRTTWPALQKHEGIEYKPERDNKALGIEYESFDDLLKCVYSENEPEVFDVPETINTPTVINTPQRKSTDNSVFNVNYFARISNGQANRIKKKDLKLNIYKQKDNEIYYARLKLSIECREHEFDLGCCGEDFAKAFIALVLMLLKALLGIVFLDSDIVADVIPHIENDDLDEHVFKIKCQGNEDLENKINNNLDIYLSKHKTNKLSPLHSIV